MKCFLQPLFTDMYYALIVLLDYYCRLFSDVTHCVLHCALSRFFQCAPLDQTPLKHTQRPPFFCPRPIMVPSVPTALCPFFRGGLLPTSSSIKWRRAERSAAVKHWLTLHCCPARRATPNLSEGDDWLPSKLSQERWWLCFNESGSQGKNHSVSKPSGQLRTAKRPFNPTFHTLFIQLFKYLH